MAHFDRYDILAAWNLYLQHTWTGQGCPKYKRHTRLNMLGWLPSHREEKVEGLDANAQEIYLALLEKDGPMPEVKHPIANPSDCGKDLFEFRFGAYGCTHLYVWGEHLEEALEEAFEWLDENAPVHLVSNERLTELYKEAAEELGFDPYTTEEDECDQITTRAEADLTICSHTTLYNGAALNSSEWYVNEITDTSDVMLASIKLNLESA